MITIDITQFTVISQDGKILLSIPTKEYRCTPINPPLVEALERDYGVATAHRICTTMRDRLDKDLAILWMADNLFQR